MRHANKNRQTKTALILAASIGLITLAGCGGGSASAPGTGFDASTASGQAAVQADMGPDASAFQTLLDNHKLVHTGFTLSKVTIQNKAEINQLEEKGMDVWMIGQGYVLGLVPDALLGNLQLHTNKIQLISKQGFSPEANFDKSYHTYDKMVTDLKAMVAAHPNLASLSTIGKSWETTNGQANRLLWAVHITGQGDGSKKPGMVIFGAHHARELVTVELPMLTIAELLDNYGKDADITSLVDSRDIWIVPMVNPDGHVHAEKGQSWRKNTDDAADNNSSLGQLGTGVDLNRNYGYQWNAPGGSSTDPGSETYRGASAFSEPETQAVRDFFKAHPNIKVMHSYHSFSNLVLWPWGYTEDPSPDAATYQAIGSKLASYNHYTPEQGSQLYVAVGITDDWTYGEMKALSFTTEVGSWGDGFDPPYSRVSKFWGENKPTDLYLLKIADHPLHSFGPDVTSVTSTRGATSTNLAIQITGNGGATPPVAGAEYFLDQPGADGSGTPIEGSFGGFSAQVAATVPHQSQQKRLVQVHAKDAQGNWGPFTAAYL